MSATSDKLAAMARDSYRAAQAAHERGDQKATTRHIKQSVAAGKLAKLAEKRGGQG